MDASLARTPTASRRGRLHHASGLADQAVVSLTSLAVLAASARGMSASQFGVVALAWGFVQVAIGGTRAVVGETILVTTRAPGRGGATGAALVAGALFAVVALPLAAVGHLRAAILTAVALGLPAVVADAVRYLLIRRHLTARLLTYDVGSAALQLVGIGAGAAMSGDAAGVVRGWCAGYVAAAVCGIALTRDWPHLRLAMDFLRRTHRVSTAYLAEALAGSVIGAVTAVLVARVAGLEAVAGYRAALSVMGVTSVAVNFVRSSYLRDLRAAVVEGRFRFGRSVALLAVGFAVVCAGAYAFLRLLPTSWGGALFGASWVFAATLLGPAAVNRFAASMSVVPTVVLRAFGVGWASASRRLLVGLAGLAAGPVGALVDGARGALLGEACTYAILTLVLLRLCGRVSRTPDAVDPAPDGVAGRTP